MTEGPRFHTLTELLDHAVARDGYIVHEGQTISYAQLRDRSQRVAAGLAAAGLRRGDHVGLSMPNSPDWLVMFFACARLGVAVMILNTRLAVSELSDLLVRSDAKGLIWQGEAQPRLSLSPQDAQVMSQLRLIATPAGGADVDGVASAAVTPFDALLAHPPRLAADAQPDDPVLLFSTSGSTGKSKLVLHCQRGIAGHASQVVQAMGLDAPGTVHFMPLPLAGAYGLVQTMVMIASGCKLVMPAGFNPAQSADLIREHGVTQLFLFDDAIAQILKAVGPQPQHPFPTVRWCAYGIFNPELKDFVASTEARGIRLVGLYGLSETQAFFVCERPGDPVELRTRTGGFTVSPQASFRIRDTETGQLLGPGQLGEIELKGPSVMLRYYGNTPAQAQMLDDGFFRTGDSGQIGPDGSLVFNSRIDDVLRLSGFLVTTGEIESVIAQAPEVEACVVVGIRVAQGNRPVAFVKPKAGAAIDPARLLAFCAERLAKYKLPIGFHAVDKFPVGGSLNAPKVDKKALREQAARLHPH
ncbi:MAG: AMP-binding protein [Pseudomonadota bacterium]